MTASVVPINLIAGTRQPFKLKLKGWCGCNPISFVHPLPSFLQVVHLKMGGREYEAASPVESSSVSSDVGAGKIG